MNLLAARMTLRPRPLWDLLDLAVPYCVVNRRPLGVMAIAALGPPLALAAFLRLYAAWTWTQVWLVLVPLGFVMDGLFTLVLGEALFRDPREMRVGALLRRFGARLGPYLVALFARAIALSAAGLVVIALPFLAPRLLFLGEAVLLENADVGKAFARSSSLSQRHGFTCLGLWLGTLLVPVAGAVMAELLGGNLCETVLQLGRPLGNLFEDGGSGFAVLGGLFGVPVAAAVRFLGYIDLRTRKEGWDIQLRFMALAARDEAETSGRSAA